jgi:glycerophosphoryl diester phosphodiesterase
MRKRRIIAHRGYSARYRENTRAAFEAAYRAGADLIELDLVLTGDGRIFVNHDLSVGGRLVRNTPLADLRESIPDSMSLEEVLEWAEGKEVGLYLDVKDRDMLLPLTDVLRDAGRKVKVIVSSSDDFLFIRRFKERNSHILTALLFRSVLPTEDMVLLARKFGGDIIHPCWENRHPYPHTLLAEEDITFMNSEGFEVVCWHEERREELERLATLGFWGITTDDPILLKDILKDKGFKI